MTRNILGGILFFSVLIFGPAISQTVDRSLPPSPGPEKTLHLPSVQLLKLSNGIPVLLLEKHDLPLFQMEVVVRAGSATDPVGKKGLASIATAMLEEGAGSRNSLEFAEAVDYLGAGLSSFTGWHSSGMTLHAPISCLDSAMGLLADAILRPRFDAEELERMRKDRFNAMMQWRDDPMAIASILSQKILFSQSHPYSSPIAGNPTDVAAITLNDVKSYYHAHFYSNNGFIVVVGDLTPSQIMPKLERLFNQWLSGEIRLNQYPEVVQVQHRTIYLVDKPGSEQSEIVFGRIGAPRSTPDYFPMLVMNDILGGAFTSRLNQNLRETHGYTYGASSIFDMRFLSGTFSAFAAVQTATTDKALNEFMNELKGIRDSLSDDEIARAKNYLILRYPGNFETVERIADRLVEMMMYGLPDDFFNSYCDHLRTVTKDDVIQIARKYIDPENIAVMIVGDKKKIEKGIINLNLGSIKYLNVEDVLGPAPAHEQSK